MEVIHDSPNISSTNFESKDGPRTVELLSVPGAIQNRDVPAVALNTEAPDERSSEAAVSEAADLSEEEIARAVQSFSGDEAERARLFNLAQQWAVLNFPAARKWVLAQPASMIREHLAQRIAFVQAQHSPEDAARLVIEEIPAGLVQTEAAIMVLHRWAPVDPDGAGEWVDRFPSGPVRNRALKELAQLRP